MSEVFSQNNVCQLTYARAHTYTYTQARTHTHTHTHTQMGQVGSNMSSFLQLEPVKGNPCI